MSRSLVLTLVLVAPFAIFGCGGEASPRRAVHGTVRVGSSQDINGSISFFPSDGNSGPATSTAIVSGQYEFTESNGPFPGMHRVVVGIDPSAMSQQTPAETPAAPAIAEGKQALLERAEPKPKRSSAGTGARKWDLKFDVPADGDSRKDFAFEVSGL
jgi:hypothetical protein